MEEQQEELHNLLERKVYSEKVFMKRNAKIQSEIDEPELKLEEAIVIEDVNYSERIIKLKDVIEKLQDDSINAKHKNDFLKEVITRVDYSIVNGEIVLEVY